MPTLLGAPRHLPGPDLGERAAEKLRDDIVAGRLRPGTRLVEAALAVEMGMSRGPIRDALDALIRERLVERDQRGGAVVRGQSREDIREIFALRNLLESYAAGMAIARLDEPQVKALSQAVDFMEWLANREDYAALGETDLSFHEALVVSCGMPRLQEMWLLLKGPMKAIIKLTDELSPDMPRTVVSAHRPIVEALSAGDTVALQQAIGAHCARTENSLLEAMGVH